MAVASFIIIQVIFITCFSISNIIVILDSDEWQSWAISIVSKSILAIINTICNLVLFVVAIQKYFMGCRFVYYIHLQLTLSAPTKVNNRFRAKAFLTFILLLYALDVAVKSVLFIYPLVNEYNDDRCNIMWDAWIKKVLIYYMYFFLHFQGIFMIIIINYLSEVEQLYN